ncbi:hypothetical protein F2Q70_00040575 [Brassica cretica]|uniref:Uncharacterized protein n=1 Tax=Brassica cretica TaxID=69181 RepID=A0A8S9K395_BRACR|nr:hypothetical protein F2Q70_00040575 [Brassica cretica]
MQYMQPVHARRHVEHEVDQPSTRCSDACDRAMRPDMWRTWCLLAWSQTMHPDSTWRRFCSSEERSVLVETSSRPVWTWVYLRRSVLVKSLSLRLAANFKLSGRKTSSSVY